MSRVRKVADLLGSAGLERALAGRVGHVFEQQGELHSRANCWKNRQGVLRVLEADEWLGVLRGKGLRVCEVCGPQMSARGGELLATWEALESSARNIRGAEGRRRALEIELDKLDASGTHGRRGPGALLLRAWANLGSARARNTDGSDINTDLLDPETHELLVGEWRVAQERHLALLGRLHSHDDTLNTYLVERLRGGRSGVAHTSGVHWCVWEAGGGGTMLRGLGAASALSREGAGWISLLSSELAELLGPHGVLSHPASSEESASLWPRTNAQGVSDNRVAHARLTHELVRGGLGLPEALEAARGALAPRR